MNPTDTTFQFVSPWWLWGLLAVPLLVFFDFYKLRLLRWPVSSLAIVSTQTRDILLWRLMEFIPSLLKGVAVVLILVALSRPRLVNQYTQITQQGIDIMLVLDASDSMHAVDMELDGVEAERMDVVKQVVKDFIPDRLTDRIGMVIFGETAFTQCPLTFDRDMLLQYVDFLDVGMAGPSTAIGNGIATAVKRLQDSEAKSKVIILLTDGKSTSGEVAPLSAADMAAQKGIRIHTIAVGSGDEAPVYVNTIFGKRKVMQRFEMDEETLKEIARRTGGTFFLARTTDMLKNVYATIDEMEKTETHSDTYREHVEYFPWLIPPALLLLFLHYGLRHFPLMRLP